MCIGMHGAKIGIIIETSKKNRQKKKKGRCGVLILLTVLVTDPTPAPFPSGARLPVAFPLHGRGGAAHITNLTGGWTGGVRGGVTGGLRILKPPVHRGFRLSTGGVGTFFEIHGVIWAC